MTGQPETDLQVWLDRLNHGAVEERRAAATNLGRCGGRQAIPALIAALKDEDRVVRWCATEALGRLGNSAALGPLAGALREERFENREIAAWALGELRNWRAVPLLIAVYEDNDEDQDVREAAAAALLTIKAALDEARDR